MDLMLLRIFQKQVLLQCQFILFAARDINMALNQHDDTRTFYAIQNLLNAAANVSKALWGPKGKFENERKTLRDSIGVSDTSPLRETLTRNAFEHFDDRLDEWWKQSNNHNYIDLSIGSIRTAISGFSDMDMFRCLNPQTGAVSFRGTDFNLNPVIDEVRRILPKLEEEAAKPHWAKEP